MPRSLAEHLDPKGPKRMLALDGGGTLGIIEIAFLERIEELLRARGGNNPAFRLCDYFDLVGGTSTGAIIAAAVGLGKSAAEIKDLYFRLAPAVFKKPLFALPFLHARFSERGLLRELASIIGDRKLSSPDVRTGIAIMTKRIDTASPWVITNNPRAKYWEDPAPDPATNKRAHIGNKHYLLADVVRASTAAPFFFEPQALSIIDTEPPGLFVDGGVSPHNNPALQLLMLAGIKGYSFNWRISKDDLLLISLGTGWRRPLLTAAQCRRMSAIELAVRALRGVTWDSQVHALTLLQWMSEPRRPWPINSEIGGLAGELFLQDTGRPMELFSFQRYDVALDVKWIEDETGLRLTPEQVLKLDDFVNPRIMKDAYEIAKLAAQRQVQPADFPEAFDVKG